jgi:hypothetical protein
MAHEIEALCGSVKVFAHQELPYRKIRCVRSALG